MNLIFFFIAMARHIETDKGLKFYNTTHFFLYQGVSMKHGNNYCCKDNCILVSHFSQWSCERANIHDKHTAGGAMGISRTLSQSLITRDSI